MRIVVIAIIILTLMLSSTVTGYCYSNVIARKTSGDTASNDSTVQIGLASGEKVTVAIGVLLGTESLAIGGTYFLLAYRVDCLRNIAGSLAGGWAGDYIGAHLESYLKYCEEHPGTHNGGKWVADQVVGPIAVIVLFITCVCIYVWWSST